MAHILPKVLVALPFVDRKPVPDERPDQRRIEWIRVGECLGAAETTIDNGGELNRSGVQVQKNAVTLYENDLILNNSLKEVIDRVNSHDDALGQIGDDNLATKVEALETEVEPMGQKIVEHTQQIFLLDESQKLMKLKLGNRDPDDATIRTVMADLAFIKRNQLGNWTNQDFNDNNVASAKATGIKFRIENQGLGIANNERRIKQLEDNWINSDVGQLKANVDEIRTELGPTDQAPAGDVYSWIKSANETHTALQANIDKIENEMGQAGAGQTIDQRITAVEEVSDQNTQNIESNTENIRILTYTVGDGTIPSSLQYRTNILETTTSKHEVALYGLDGSSGISVTVNTIGAEIGTDDDAPTIKGRLKTSETNILKVQQDVATIKTQIGINISGSETGIYRRIKNLETSVGDDTSGLTKQVAENTAAVATKLSDAPNDSKQYVRTGGAWADLSTYLGDQSVKAAGGGYFKDQTGASTTTTPSAGTDLVLPQLTEYTFNTEVEIESNKLKFVRGHDAICQVNVQLRVKSSNSKDSTFDLLKNGVVVGTTVIKEDEWSTVNHNAIINLSVPVSLKKDDLLSLQVTTTDADEFEVTDGQIYVVQMS